MKIAWKFLPFFAVAALAAAAGPVGAAWWNSAWPYQREVTVLKVSPSGLPGEDMAVVTFPTGGAVKADGGDIRVTSDSGRELPSRVLMMGPGDQARVAFAIQPGFTRYYVYYGNPDPVPGKKLDVQRGVLLETWGYSGSIPSNLSRAQAVFDKATSLQGRDFVNSIFLGFNPFGPSSAIASVFTGYLNCKEAGKYVFACMSHGASFLLVDDKLLIDHGGPNRGNRRDYKTQEISLSAGLHKLTYYHVNGAGGDPVAVLAWQPPGGKRLEPISGSAFAPAHRAEPGPMKRYGTAVDIDFVPVHANETFTNDRYYQRYTFEALTVGTPGRDIQWRWDFGDGQTSAEEKVDHVYLLPGLYTVKLSAKTRVGDLERTNRIYVTRNWARVTATDLDSLKLHAKIVAKYNFTALNTTALTEAVDLLRRADDTDSLLRAGQAFVGHAAAERKEIEAVLPVYADALVSVKAGDKAVAALEKGAQMNRSSATQALLLHQAGRICLDALQDTDKAMALFTRVVKDYAVLTTSPPVRGSRVGIGDVWRARGDYEQAAKAYESARGREEAKIGREPIVKGDFARHVEDFLRTREYGFARESLDEWQNTFPADKLEGYWSLLSARLDVARKDYAAAVREVETLVRVNPASNYAAELLMLAADCHLKLGDATRAKAAWRRIAEKYPESPLAAVAVRKLGEPVKPEEPNRTNTSGKPAEVSEEGAGETPAPAKGGTSK